MKEILVISIFLMFFSSSGQTTDSQNTKLANFQKFVNGEMPIKEAIVYRKILKSDGTLVNQDWWRFGLQAGTWYVQRLQPDANQSGRLVPRPGSAIYGASYSNLWAVSDHDIHIVAKTSAMNSLMEKNSLERNLMFATLSLGVPRALDVQTIEDSHVEWKGLEFTTTVGRGNKKSPLTGKLTLTSDMLPASAVYPSVGEFAGGLVSYEYKSEIVDIPISFVAKYAGTELRYEFLSLELGSNDLSQSGGYVPSRLADTNVARLTTIWTNDKAYSLINGKTVPAFDTHPEIKRHRAIILALMTAISIAFTLLLLYFHSKQQTTNK